MHLCASWRESYKTSLFLQLLISAGSPFCFAASSFFLQDFNKKRETKLQCCSKPHPHATPTLSSPLNWYLLSRKARTVST